MQPSEIESRIRAYIATSFGHRGGRADLNGHLDLLEQGILDSTAVLEVIAFMEQDLGITVDDEDMVPDNLGTISHMVAFVDRKRRAAAVRGAG
jgi:acyl carrier protein